MRTAGFGFGSSFFCFGSKARAERKVTIASFEGVSCEILLVVLEVS